MLDLVRVSISACVAVGCLYGSDASAAWQTAGATVRGDFNNDGVLELVASNPEADGNEGAVEIVDLANGTATRWTRDKAGLAGASAAAGDYFGAALAVGDFDGDGYDDLVIGVPGADDSGETDSGAIHVVYGSSSGLSTIGDQLFHQDTTGIDGVAENYDGVGDVLATGDFNCDGYSDVVIGVPNEGVSSASGAGATQVLYGGAGGVSTVDDIYHQGAGGVDGVPEAGDHFGGAVVAGNFNGDLNGGIPCEDLAIASPDEDVGSISDAGYVYTVLGGVSGLSTTGDLAWHQDTSGVEDSAEAGDRFGARLLARDLDNDGYDELEVVVPGDSCLASHGEAIHQFAGSPTGISLSGDALECYEYDCQIAEAENEYLCLGDPKMVYGTSAAESFTLHFGDDVVFAGTSNDSVVASLGNDVIFGGSRDDVIDGGGGADIAFGGSGNDTFVIDLDCEAQAGEVVDGGSGTDTVRSHLTRLQLEAAGVRFESIESFVVIGADPDTMGVGCEPYFAFTGTPSTPSVALEWSELPDPDDVITTSTGLLTLQVTNTVPVPLAVDLEFSLLARGSRVVLEASSGLSLQPAGQSGDRTSYPLDLNDFIPTGVDPQTVDPDLLDLPASARLVAVAFVTHGSTLVESPVAMPLYGHLEGSAAVIYGPEALRSVYNGGDLAHLAQTPQTQTGLAGATEAVGSYGIPPEFKDP